MKQNKNRPSHKEQSHATKGAPKRAAQLKASPRAPAAKNGGKNDAPSAPNAKSKLSKAPEKPFVPQVRRPTPAELALKESLNRFEGGLGLFNHNQFAKARTVFERLTEDPARELAERARVYVNICDQRLKRMTPQLKSAEDLYNYAVRLANEGNPQEAEQHLRKALKISPQADYIYYALATTYAQREDIEGALENLLKAIELNERNRYQAQNDGDFANLLEDPRFTELLYPEKPVA